jgi:hypothetical protein
MQKLDLCSLPKSLKEAKATGSHVYFTGVPCKHGHLTYRYVVDRICSECAKLKVKKASTVGGGNARRWAAKTEQEKAEIYAKRREYYQKTKEARRAEKMRSYFSLMQDAEWVEKRRKKVAEYRRKNGRKPETVNPEVKKRYKQSVKGKVSSNAADAKRRAAELQRTPAWLTHEQLEHIKKFYELAAMQTRVFGFKWVVDHEIPLQGKLVSGLHVPSNLRVITETANAQKGNKYVPA